MAFKLNHIDIFTASWGPNDNGETLGKKILFQKIFINNRPFNSLRPVTIS